MEINVPSTRGCRYPTVIFGSIIFQVDIIRVNVQPSFSKEEHLSEGCFKKYSSPYLVQNNFIPQPITKRVNDV